MASLRSIAEFQRVHGALLARLHSQASTAGHFLAAPRFAEAMYRSALSHFTGAAAPANPGHASDGAVAQFLESLHVADLSLATACADGVPEAWDFFVAEFRPALYTASRALAGDAGPELADSLYADLFGLEVREGRRRSLFDYFHGRSKLSTWLRSVLAQRQIDRLRAASRTVSLDAAGDSPQEAPSAEASAARTALATSATSPSADPDRPRYLASLQAALAEAIKSLPPKDRLRLSSYYLQDLTLAQIGKILGEHEATVSRKLDRTRRDIRSAVERQLRENRRLSDAQIQLCFEYAQEEWPFDLTRALS